MYSNIDEAWQASNALDKYKNSFKPVTSVADTTNEIKGKMTTESESSDRSSKHSEASFKSEEIDLKKLLKKDDNMQCDKLYGHFQVCKTCRDKIIEKFSMPEIKYNDMGSTLRLTESFIDLSKYADILKNKKTSNIVSIILFGLLIIIILSLFNNESK